MKNVSTRFLYDMWTISDCLVKIISLFRFKVWELTNLLKALVPKLWNEKSNLPFVEMTLAMYGVMLKLDFYALFNGCRVNYTFWRNVIKQQEHTKGMILSRKTKFNFQLREAAESTVLIYVNLPVNLLHFINSRTSFEYKNLKDLLVS